MGFVLSGGNVNKTKIRKPSILRTRNIYAKCVVDFDGRVVVSIQDRGKWWRAGASIPSNDELAKLTEWTKRVRAYARSRK